MPSTQSRRMLLLSAGTALSTPLSGCLSVSEFTRESKLVSIAEVWIKNLGDSPVVFDVVIEDVTDNEVVFWETHPTRPMADRDDDGNEEIDMHSWKNPVQSPGNYALHARAEADDPAGGKQVTSTRIQTDVDCPSILVEIGIMGELSIDVDAEDVC
ncbi:hypothetical protein [Haloplanus halophilus]|uniref:hypothetical protein n=1 Tax=Haloplanus halophilus TaxID=2949993 RepID=UPI002042480A|nr:hypothetical protein [Haloplanus sp. GDY1]